MFCYDLFEFEMIAVSLLSSIPDYFISNGDTRLGMGTLGITIDKHMIIVINKPMELNCLVAELITINRVSHNKQS